MRLGIDRRLAGRAVKLRLASSASITFMRSTLLAFFTPAAHRCMP